MRSFTPRIMMIASMAIFGTLAPFVRNIPISSGELALSRAVLAAAIIGCYFMFTRKKFDLASIKKELVLLALSGMAMGINWVLLFEAYKYTTVSVATLGYYFAPVIVTIACPILFREKLGKKQILCFVMSTVGLCLVIGFGGFAGGGKDHIGILFALGAAVFYATVMLLNKFIRGVSGIERTFFQFLGAIIILVPYVALSGGIMRAAIEPLGWASLLIVGIVHTGITYCLYFSALKSLPGQEAAILSYIDPLVAVIVSVTVLSEPLTAMQIAGGALILGFTLLNEITIKKASE